MPQAIVSRYFGPENARFDQRYVMPRAEHVSAWADAGTATLEWDPELYAVQNHVNAAQALCSKLGWAGHWFMGELPGGEKVFVCSANTRAMFDAGTLVAPAFFIEPL